MSAPRSLARLGAITTALAATTLLAAGPAGAHVSVTPSVATAGAHTLLTVSVPHACEGSPTTKIEVEIPEEILSVVPTRNPYWTEKATIETLDEPVTDAHGNEITERVGTVVYAAKTPLPEGVRDSFELSFQVPDVAGETLVFPTIQTCEKGQTAWTEVPEEGQDAHDLALPAPSFEVLPAEAGHDDHDAATDDDGDEASDHETDHEAEADGDSDNDTDSDSNALGWAGLGAGLLGLLAGGTALVRSRPTS